MAATIPRSVDILHVSAGTTGGWRIIDETLRRALHDLGVTVERVAVKRPRDGVVRRAGSPVNDVRDAAALALAARRGLGRVRPRAIVYSSSHAALFQRPRRVPEAVWIDGPIAIMRPGVRSAPLRALERRRQRRLDLVLPMSLQQPDLLARPLRPKATAPLHMPVDPFTAHGKLPAGIKPPFGVTYAGAPGKKGLDIAVEGWRLAAPGMPLVVTGITVDQAVAYLGGRVPDTVVVTGPVPRTSHRELVRRSNVYVSASRREEYGTAQMEALAEGIPLAAVPSEGAVEPVAVARRLRPDLVAVDISAESLARCIGTALTMPPGERDRYASSARELMRAYSYDAFKDRLARDVLPVLLG